MLTGLDWIWIIWSSRTSQVNFLQPQVESDSSSRTGICVPTQVGKKEYQILPGQVSSRRWDLITPRKTRGYVVGHPLPETQGHPSPHDIRSLLQWSRDEVTCEVKLFSATGVLKGLVEVLKRSQFWMTWCVRLFAVGWRQLQHWKRPLPSRCTPDEGGWVVEERGYQSPPTEILHLRVATRRNSSFFMNQYSESQTEVT